MKKLTTLCSAAILASAFSMPATAEVSGNIGFVSDYYFRGANLGDGGVYGGLDYESNGFFAGTWWIDDGSAGNDGLEADFYLGYGMEYDSMSWSASYSRYTYTYTNDYEHEFGLNLTFGDFSIDLVTGDDEDDGMDAVGYEVVVLGYSHKSFGIEVGAFSDDNDAEYEWAQISFSGELSEGLEASLNVGAKKEDGANNDGFMFLDISKSFDLF